MAHRIRYAASALPIVTMTDNDADNHDAVHHEVDKALSGSAEYSIAASWVVNMAESFTTTYKDYDSIAGDTVTSVNFIAMQNLDASANLLVSLDTNSNYPIQIYPGMTLALKLTGITGAELCLKSSSGTISVNMFSDSVLG